MKRFALVSVYDKTGLEPFVRGLVSLGFEILSTGGTAKFLQDAGFSVINISNYTGQAEILEGRVKTLHPMVHAGILARRNCDDDIRELTAIGAGLIDLVVVNLYPFVDKVREIEAKGDPAHPLLIEFIDIGGPCMLRAAAKNNQFVLPVCDITDYETVLAELKAGEVSQKTRQWLAAKVFMTTASYDGEIARYFSLEEKLLSPDGKRAALAPVEAMILAREEELRYGENPHQQAALYRKVTVGGAPWHAPWTQLQGKEISYNNLIDSQAAIALCAELSEQVITQALSVIIKHMNPCGVAVRNTAREAFTEARSCDPLSAFGGIIAVNTIMDNATAEAIVEGFVEVVIAPSFSPEAIEVLSKKKNVRLLAVDYQDWRTRISRTGVTVRDVADAYLLQSPDSVLAKVKDAVILSEVKTTNEMLQDLELAWSVCKHVKSNAIVIVKDRKAIGIGAGQMSRVDSARLSIDRARIHQHDLRGAVAASDAFLPFADTLEILADAGIVALVQPGGAMRDGEVLEVANKLKMVMVVTGERHFRH